MSRPRKSVSLFFSSYGEIDMQLTCAMYFVFAAASLSFTAAADSAQAAPSSSAGKSLALSGCAYCHVVALDQNFLPPLKPQGPDFSSIAADPTFNAKRLRTFLLTTHRDIARGKAMPNPILENTQIDELIRFILASRPAP